jgi:excisionase family DNA binding protein
MSDCAATLTRAAPTLRNTLHAKRKARHARMRPRQRRCDRPPVAPDLSRHPLTVAKMTKLHDIPTAVDPAPGLAVPLLRPAEAAELLSMRPSWIYEAVRTNRLPCLRVGRHIRTREMLESWLAEQRGSRSQVDAAGSRVSADRRRDPGGFGLVRRGGLRLPPWGDGCGAALARAGRVGLLRTA